MSPAWHRNHRGVAAPTSGRTPRGWGQMSERPCRTGRALAGTRRAQSPDGPPRAGPAECRRLQFSSLRVSSRPHERSPIRNRTQDSSSPPIRLPMPTDRPRHSRGRRLRQPRPRSHSRRRPSATERRWPTIQRRRSARSARASPRVKARTIGIRPPPKPRSGAAAPAASASVAAPGPWWAMTCLFAVTTDLPAVGARALVDRRLVADNARRRCRRRGRHKVANLSVHPTPGPRFGWRARFLGARRSQTCVRCARRVSLGW